MTDDHLRQAAYDAVTDHLRQHLTNAVANAYVWAAVNQALDAYEDQMALDMSNGLLPGWALMHEGRPILIVPTKRIARGQRKILATLAQKPRRHWQIVRTEVGLSR